MLIVSSCAYISRRERLDGRAALGAAVEREVDPGLGLVQRQLEPGVVLAEWATEERGHRAAVGAQDAVLDVV